MPIDPMMLCSEALGAYLGDLDSAILTGLELGGLSGGRLDKLDVGLELLAIRGFGPHDGMRMERCGGRARNDRGLTTWREAELSWFEDSRRQRGKEKKPICWLEPSL